MAAPGLTRKLGFSAIVTVGVLLVLEVLAQVIRAPDLGELAEPEHTLPGQEPIMLRGSPYLLWELAPGERTEHGGQVAVNEAGFRDRERGEKTGPRLLALGDSSIYGFGVHDAEVFTAVLEERLQGEAAGTEVINAGVPGYSTEQALNRLLRGGLDLEPDVLLVGTLWSDNNFDQFVDGELIVRYGSWSERPEARVRRALELSGLFRWLDYGLRGGLPMPAFTVGWMTSPGQATGERRVPIDDYARNLARFCELMADRDGGIVFVQLANIEDLRPSVEDPPWVPYREVMDQTAERCGAPLVSVPAAYAATKGSPRELFLDEMHPTARGHAVLAEAVHSALSEAGWPAQPLKVEAPSSPVTGIDDPFEGRGRAATRRRRRWRGAGSRAVMFDSGSDCVGSMNEAWYKAGR